MYLGYCNITRVCYCIYAIVKLQKKVPNRQIVWIKIFFFFQPTKLSFKSINPVDVADFHTRGVTSPEKDPPRVMSARKPIERFPRKFKMYS